MLVTIGFLKPSGAIRMVSVLGRFRDSIFGNYNQRNPTGWMASGWDVFPSSGSACLPGFPGRPQSRPAAMLMESAKMTVLKKKARTPWANA